MQNIIKKVGSMKIDLHCHTKKTKSGDPETRNVTKDVFLQKLSDASVSIAAITNHNHFDLNQYKSFASNDKGIKVLPGVELDIKGKSSKGHCILITSPDKATLFNDFITSILSGKTADEFELDIETFVNKIKGQDFIVIPHYHKDKSLNDEDIVFLKTSVGNVPVLLETSNLRSAGIMIANNQTSIIGSDVKNWNNYGMAHLPELKIPIDSYQQFVKLLRKDIPTIESFVKGRFGEEVRIHPDLYPDCDLKLDIYNDINVIFGGKGTGKTELLLKEIEKYFKSKGNSDVSTYYPNDKDSSTEFDNLKITKPKEFDLEIITETNLSADFVKINNYEAVPITPTSDYLKWLNGEKTKGAIFGFADATFTESIEAVRTAYETEKTHFANSKKAVASIKTVAKKPYIEEKDIISLEKITSELIVISWKYVVQSFCRYQSSSLTKWSINKLKTIYQNKKGVKVKPVQTGFVSLFENSNKLFNSSKIIKFTLEKKSAIVKTPIGNLIDKGTIYKEVEYSINATCCKGTNPKSQYLSDNMNKTLMSDVKHAIDLLVTNSFSNGEQKAISNYKKIVGQLNILSLSDFLFCNTRIVDEQNNSYEPSSGEKAMLMLNFKLMDDNKNVYILDEPEAKVGHKYINEVIINRLIELSRKEKKVIITTHDANIAVRTLPLASIFREQYRDIGDPTPKYRTYIGSPFKDSMICYEDKTKIVDWVKASMDTLEGGVDAFIEREENYNYGR